MAIQNTTRKVSEVVEYVKRQFGDESGVQVTDTDLIRWINDGQMEIVAANKILRAKAVAHLIEGQANYDFPLDRIIDIEAIHVDGIPVQYMKFPDSEKYIIEQDPKRERTGQPLYWYDYANQITFWPKPDKDINSGITVFYVAEPHRVEELTETLSIPDRYYNSLVRYVLAQAYEMDEDWQASRFKQDQFQADLADLAGEEDMLSTAAYPTITFR